MTKPATVSNIDYIKYNCVESGDTDPVWKDIKFLPIHDFIDFAHNYNPSETNVDTMTVASDAFTLTFHYQNDTAPCYYTVLEDNTLIFDAYDSVVDTTLQSSKTLGFGGKDVIFIRSDVWVPELEADQFALLLHEAKSLAWLEQKQSEHPKAERAARRNWQHLARTRRTTPTDGLERKETSFRSLVNFSRK